jgi:hypothetical protein
MDITSRNTVTRRNHTNDHPTATTSIAFKKFDARGDASYDEAPYGQVVQVHISADELLMSFECERSLSRAGIESRVNANPASVGYSALPRSCHQWIVSYPSRSSFACENQKFINLSRNRPNLFNRGLMLD